MPFSTLADRSDIDEGLKHKDLLRQPASAFTE